MVLRTEEQIDTCHRKQFHNDGFTYRQKYLPDAILFACSDLPSDVSYYTVDLYNRNKRSKDVLVGEKTFYPAVDAPTPGGR